MADMKQIHEFAVKWFDKFRDKKINYLELVDHYIADDCEALGFVMDCGHAFAEKYGDAASNFEALERVIDQVTDIPLLGSAIYSQWRYFIHWAYSGEEILEPKNREWFSIALSRLGELAIRQLNLFKGDPQKVRIVSNNICYGPPPEPDDEVEQHITINADGRVWFSAYNFGSGFGEHEKARSKIFKIEKATAAKVLSAIASYFGNGYMEWFATDIGDWNMEITNTEGAVYKFQGSLCCDIEVDGADLSDMIRDVLGMDDLDVFDGNHKPDRVDRVTVDYHRITKIKPKQPVSETAEYVTWDYTERLVIDRESETIEHIQNIGSGCVVSRKFYVQGGIEDLLDDIDADDLFGEIEGNPDNVADDPLESKDYTITVDFKKGPQRVIQGTYDKKALPEFWGDFADDVWNFIQFYGCGEILDPAVYRKVKRCRNDYVYCSVEFDEGYKSYYYIADEDNIRVGDRVIVPVGRDNHHSAAEVVKVEYFAEDDVPLPLGRTKHIIRKCTDEDFVPPKEQYCMSKITLLNASCADQTVDAVVNAANSGLWAGGGICGVIFKKAGMAALKAACNEYKTPLKDGSAVITPAFNMTNAKHIIHAVGPDFGRTPAAFKELFDAYYNSLYVLMDNGLHSISFPLISSGIFGGSLENPVAESTKQCCRAYKKFVADYPNYDVDVKLCAFSAKEMQEAQKVFDSMI